MKKIGLDDFILECWGVDDGGWKFSLISDMWWELVAVSESLGRFRIVSANAFDVEVELAELLDTIKEAKEKKAIYDFIN